VRVLLHRRALLCFLVIWLLAAVIGLALAAQPAHELSDVTHYKLWTHLVTTRGVAAMYSGEYPESYVIYPPVTMYGLWVVGHVYQAVVDRGFDTRQAQASRWLTFGIRLMALSVHLILGLVIILLLRQAAEPWQATVGAGLYLLNPGAMWDVAIWGQPDSWHSLFALLGFWFIGCARPLAGGGWLGLAAMTKPQAWALLPLASVAVLAHSFSPKSDVQRVARRRRLDLAAGSGQAVGRGLQAAIGGAAVILLVLLPFLVGGRLSEALTLPEHISTVMPVSSANAHNLWWLVTRGASAPFVFDHERFVGPLTYRQAALLMLVAVLAFTLWRAWLARGPWELAALAAYTSHSWFCLTTGAHENHPFMIFPFLCLVWWRSRFLAVVLILLIASFSFNVLAHDLDLEPLFQATLGEWNWRLQMAASGLNLLILASWTGWLVRQGGGPAGVPQPSTR
jgi:hypothetical protein